MIDFYSLYAVNACRANVYGLSKLEKGDLTNCYKAIKGLETFFGFIKKEVTTFSETNIIELDHFFLLRNYLEQGDYFKRVDNLKRENSSPEENIEKLINNVARLRRKYLEGKEVEVRDDFETLFNFFDGYAAELAEFDPSEGSKGHCFCA
jgi:hypothetical protein